jgi:transcriptional regulator with XRE-family HTH domain
MSEYNYHPLYEKIRDKNEFLLEELRVLIIENIIDLMDSQGIGQAELAKRLGTSRAYITKLFNTSINLTLESLVKISKALGVKTTVHFHAPEARAVWFDVYESTGYKYDAPSVFTKERIQYEIGTPAA